MESKESMRWLDEYLNEAFGFVQTQSIRNESIRNGNVNGLLRQLCNSIASCYSDSYGHADNLEENNSEERQ